MKTMPLLVALLALAIGFNVAQAKDKTSDGPKPIHGSIAKIDGNTLTIKLGKAHDGTQPAPLTVTLTDTTTYAGELKGKDDLKVGAKVAVTVDADNKVTKIEVKAPTTQKK